MLEASCCSCCQDAKTRHDGSLSTGHSNSPRDMLSRIETMVLMGMEIPIEAVRQQISSAVDIIVHLGRIRDRSRKVVQIAEVGDCRDGEIILTPLFKFVEEGESPDGKVLGRLIRQDTMLKRIHKLEAAGIKEW